MGDARGNRAGNAGGRDHERRQVHHERVVLGPRQYRRAWGGIALTDLRPAAIDPTLTMNDSSSVRGNRAANGGGGIFGSGSTVILMGPSSVHGNTDDGIWRIGHGTVILKGSSSVCGERRHRDPQPERQHPDLERIGLG